MLPFAMDVSIPYSIAGPEITFHYDTIKGREPILGMETVAGRYLSLTADGGLWGVISDEWPLRTAAMVYGVWRMVYGQRLFVRLITPYRRDRVTFNVEWKHTLLIDLRHGWWGMTSHEMTRTLDTLFESGTQCFRVF
jgi:hypothetical protein